MLRILAVVWVCVSLGGCTTGKVIATPFTAVRDTVDLPVVSLTNFFAWIARSSGGPSAYAGPSWSLRGGFNFGIGLNFASWIFWGFSGVTGSVDYIVCRSLYPNFPAGVSPWKKRGESFGSMLFPNTKALWKEGKKDGKELPPPAPHMETASDTD
jgi:hypothetical protein